MATAKLTIGRLATLSQVSKAVAKVIRGMARGEIETQDGARLAHSLGILRACLEAERAERIEARLTKLLEQVQLLQARKVGNGAYAPFNGQLMIEHVAEHPSDGMDS